MQRGISRYWPSGTEVVSSQDSVDLSTGKQDTLEKRLKDLQNKRFDVVFVVLNDKSIHNYERLKHVADVIVGVHTICTVVDRDWRPNQFHKSYPTRQIKSLPDQIANLMLKCNLKLGGDNVTLELPTTDDLTSQQVRELLSPTTMIVGADVTHPGPGAMDGAESIAAVVASEDSSFNRYPASFRCQTGTMEMIADLDGMLKERLEHWRAVNNKNPATNGKMYPERILFYRDGVSEGQFKDVLEKEWPQIQYAIAVAYAEVQQPPAKTILFSVLKRHHTRFYTNNLRNPDPGLLVANSVTYPHKYDFYLQSHASPIGTARPAHYVVLKDEIDFSADAVQQATFWQCHLYGRCTKSISINPATRMADRACARARCYLAEYLRAQNQQQQVFNQEFNARGAWSHNTPMTLKNSMFYI